MPKAYKFISLKKDTDGKHKWVATILNKATNREKRVRFGAIGYEDMARRVPDLTKIKKFTNWTPRINLDKIILDVANYELQRNLAHP